ncbi:hypothetical protein CLV96_3934 [Leptospira meyeri]|uniref:Uncharacterized protein n=1 Tax=Leptospira meyeri TaxID=29508 RepID=A0A4R8MIM7_LEPME|nr:putative membrane protein [Leptospira meyeri serovar Hardjo str. Went 5]TDY66364.1 hypothetical protein CLV96_3934 [Leptospira meyeri]
MKEFIMTVESLYKNQTARKLLNLIVIFAFVSYLYSTLNNFNIKRIEFYIYFLYSITCTYYIIFNFYKVIYQLTSLVDLNKELAYWDFFWNFIKFQSRLSMVLVFPISFLILFITLESPLRIDFKLSTFNYLKIPTVFFLIEFFIFTYSIFSIIFIGTRNFENAFSKLGSLFRSRKINLFILIFLMLTILFLTSLSLQFTNFTINLLIKTTSLILGILSFLIFLCIIRIWQKKLYENKNKIY